MTNNNIIRTPIQLDKNTLAIIHIFERKDHLEDIWMFDSDKYEEELWRNFDQSAKQFIDQIIDKVSPHFLMELIKVANKELINHDKKFGTNFSKNI